MAASDPDTRSWSTGLPWAGCVLLLGTLVLPFVLAAVDHHGIERVPSHSHLRQAGAAVRQEAPHTHEFEIDHGHDASADPSGASAVALVNSTAAAQVSASSPATPVGTGFLSLALLSIVLGAALQRQVKRAVRDALTPAGARWSPPRHPPPLLSSF